ncbi:uncharacterized protein LOC127392778 [Apus apus]|uniref:uncharacterized protein LOC127392778 n=1 Tax=Apus apus TaxID=8895 RepID=UPI0021F8E155|nr:uncharacterized protein LOC127392778 [Apus apus]
MGTPEGCPCSGMVFGGQDTDPQEMTTKGSRQINSTCQLSVYRHSTSGLEAACHIPKEWMGLMEKEITQIKDTLRNLVFSVDALPQALECCCCKHAACGHCEMQVTRKPNHPCQEGYRSYQGEIPGQATQKELQQEEEIKELKKKNKKLQERIDMLLPKVMSMHQHSENMNDPFRLSAVLEKYERFMLQGWGKFRTSRGSCVSYEDGSKLIKKLFDACEKDMEQRKTGILKLLNLPPSDYSMTNSEQEVMQKIREILRHPYCQNNSEIYSKIARQAAPGIKFDSLKLEFAQQCCEVYCLLLLQDPPIKAAWQSEGISDFCAEHVDKKSSALWRQAAFLWPVMKCEGKVIMKGVVWD